MCGIYKLYPQDIPYASHSPQITPEGTIPPFPIDILKKISPCQKKYVHDIHMAAMISQYLWSSGFGLLKQRWLH